MLRNQVSNMLTYYCAKCDPPEKFTTSMQFNAHNLEKHESGKQQNEGHAHVCTSCGRVWNSAFSSRSGPRQHLIRSKTKLSKRMQRKLFASSDFLRNYLL